MKGFLDDKHTKDQEKLSELQILRRKNEILEDEQKGLFKENEALKIEITQIKNNVSYNQRF